MTNPATVVALTDRWRPLDENETTVGQTYLDSAWVKLKRKVDGIEALTAADPDLEADVVHLLATATLRVLKNLDGLKSESVDDFSANYDGDVASGRLYFTDEELDELVTGSGEQGRAFSVDLLCDYESRFDA